VNPEPTEPLKEATPMSEDRFVLLEPGAARPGRIPLPPAFAVKATTDDTEGRLSVLEVTLAQDIPRHVHRHADECVYVLDGVLEIEFGDRGHQAPKGTFALLPLASRTPSAAPATRRPGSCRSPRPAAGRGTSRT
jgi:hypothetical protein